MKKSLKIAVGIPTSGRAAILRETLKYLRCQRRQPDMVVVCGTKTADVEAADIAFPGARLLLPPAPGLTRQRNAIIDVVSDADILIFFDDDFLPDVGYLAAIEHVMTNEPHIAVATGRVLVDGIIGPGLTTDEGHKILTQNPPHAAASEVNSRVFTGYGCNMAVRMALVQQNGIRFDDRLPLYGWQEDVDFSRRLGAFGDIVQVEHACGVHLGVKSGRASGVRLGYSQVANPLYLSSKRAGYPFRRALGHLARNIAMNTAKSFRPEPYVDRRGRLHGNILALADVVRGRIRPERVLEL